MQPYFIYLQDFHPLKLSTLPSTNWTSPSSSSPKSLFSFCVYSCYFCDHSRYTHYSIWILWYIMHLCNICYMIFWFNINRISLFFSRLNNTIYYMTYFVLHIVWNVEHLWFGHSTFGYYDNANGHWFTKSVPDPCFNSQVYIVQVKSAEMCMLYIFLRNSTCFL